MEGGDGGNKPWHLFTSEDMIQGYKSPKRRKRVNKPVKEIIFKESCQRTPLSDLTNLGQTQQNQSVNEKRKGKGPMKQWEDIPLKEWGRNLFEQEYNQSSDSIVPPHDDHIEESNVEDFCLSDDGLFDSDDSYEDSSTYNLYEDYTDCESEANIGNENNLNSHVHNNRKHYGKHVIPEEYASLGSPSRKCSHCNAQMWHEERVNKNVTKGIPVFSICCKKGEVKLPPTPPTPPYLLQLYNDGVKSEAFMRSIRLYNAMFQFTSTGGNVDHSINRGRGPYIYRLNGQNHHVFGSLIPDDGQTPKFCQLYIYDTANEVNNRLRWVSTADQQIVEAEVIQGLIRMLDETNELVEKFRMARDRFENHDFVDLKVELKVCRSESGRENHISPSDEVAGIMVGSTSNTTPDRDIIIHPKMGNLQRVSYIHPKLMSLQYPLLFPNGEDGYHDKIPFQSADLDNLKDHDYISMIKYWILL